MTLIRNDNDVISWHNFNYVIWWRISMVSCGNVKIFNKFFIIATIKTLLNVFQTSRDSWVRISDFRSNQCYKLFHTRVTRRPYCFLRHVLILSSSSCDINFFINLLFESNFVISVIEHHQNNVWSIEIKDW